MSSLGAVDRTPSERVDVCVIGAGPAGALCAYKLADQGYDVVVLEAGKEFDFERRIEQLETDQRIGDAPSNVWDMGGERDRFVNSGDYQYSLNQKRVKGIGGSSLHWGGNVWRLHEKDFEMETRYGLASDWPISYADLQPYYAAAEQEIGVSGDTDNPFSPPRNTDFPMPAFPPSYSDEILTEAAAELDITMHSSPRAQASEAYDGRSRCVGYGNCATCPSGAKYTAEIHVRKAIEAGARVIDQVPVQLLEHDQSGDILESAVYVSPDGETHRQRADQFVLAAGGVEIPRLLLQSKSDQYPDGLANSSGFVGRNFMDHCYVAVVGHIDEDTHQHQIGFETLATQQFYDHDEPTPGSFILTFKNNAGQNPLRTALMGGDFTRRNDTQDPVLGDEWGDDLLATLRQGGQGLRIIVGAEMLPDRSNRISLDGSRNDDRDNPVPDVSFSVGSHAVETLRKGISIAKQVLEQAGAKRITAGDPTNPIVGGHHMGTTRMGVNPRKSVVTPQLRTHDVDNCWIPSSSVFVTGGAAHPTLTIAALALKTADHVVSRL